MKPRRVGGSSICKASGWGAVTALLPLRRPRKPTSAESAPSAAARPSVHPGARDPAALPPVGRLGAPPVIGASRSGTNHDQPWQPLDVLLHGGNRNDGCAVRSWIRPALGGQRPGHEHARGSCLRVGSSSEIRTQLAPTPTGGPYRGLCTDAMRPGATAPTGAGARPGPPAGCPPCRAGRSGTHLPAHGFHISLLGWRILGPDGRHRGSRPFPRPGARAAAATRGRRSPRSARARR